MNELTSSSGKIKVGFLCINAFSGGNIVIFEHAYYIFKRGNVDVCLIFPETFTDNDGKWFDRISEIPKSTYAAEKNQEYDLLIATYWRTCYDLHKFKSKKYLYFNQSVESKFYDKTNVKNIFLAEATYMLDLGIITEAHWIQDYIKSNYGVESQLVLNGINKSNYVTDGSFIEPRTDGKLRVLVEGSLEAPNKNVPKTIELCTKSKADEIWLLTNSKIDAYEGIDRVFSQVPVEKTQEIYRSCDVLVKLSRVEGMFGPPLEMFHCGGTAISYNVSGHDEYMVDDVNSFVVEMEDEASVIKKINFLKDNPDKLKLLKENALITANNWYDWNSASERFEEILNYYSQQENSDQGVLKNKTNLFLNIYNTIDNQAETIKNINKKIGLKIHERIAKMIKGRS